MKVESIWQAGYGGQDVRSGRRRDVGFRCRYLPIQDIPDLYLSLGEGRLYVGLRLIFETERRVGRRRGGKGELVASISSQT